MRISDWSSDVCSSDLISGQLRPERCFERWSFARRHQTSIGQRRTRGREIVGKSPLAVGEDRQREMMLPEHEPVALQIVGGIGEIERLARCGILGRGHLVLPAAQPFGCPRLTHERSEEHTSELQSLMRISSAFFCLKKKKIQKHMTTISINVLISLSQHLFYHTLS